MANTDVGSALIVSYDARIDKLEKAWKRATEGSERTFRSLDRRSKASAQQIEANMLRASRATDQLNARLAGISGKAFTGVAQNAALALAPVLSVTAAIAGTKRALQELGDIADSSKRAGLDAEFFQGFGYQAKLSGVEIEGTSSALSTFNKNMGQLEAGTGRAFAQLQKLDPALLSALQAATTQQERLRLAADAIDRAQGSAQKAALAAALFGEQGGALVDAFNGGAGKIDEMQTKARELGQVIDNDVIDRADALGDEFDTITGKINSNLNTALVNLGPVLIWLAELAANVTGEFAGLADALRSPQDFAAWLGGGSGAESRLRGTMSDMANELSSFDIGRALNEDRSGGIAEYFMGAGVDRANAIGPGINASDLQKWFDVRLRAAPSSPAIDEPPAPDWGMIPTLNNGVRTSGGAGATGTTPSDASTRRESARAAVDQADAVKDLIEGLQFEQQLLGLSETDQRVANELRRVGATATEDQKRQIEDLIRSLDRQKEALEANQKAGQFLGETLGNSLIDVVMGAESAEEAIKGLLSQLARAALQAAFMGTGPLGGLTGGVGLFSALGFAEGGYTGTGGKHVPAGVVHKGEVVWSQADVARHGGAAVVDAMRRLPRFAEGGIVGRVPTLPGARAAAPSVTIHAPVTVNGSAGTPAQNHDLARQMSEQLENTVRGLVNDELANAMRPGGVANNRTR
jgi:hypothetical protein